MRLYKDISDWLAHRKSLNPTGGIGFVPTMGALHKGHLSLVKRSVDENELTVVSIFVNPTQFNDPNDLDNYPRTLDADLDLLEAAGVDAVILPSQDQIYPDGYRYQVLESELSLELCGASRPGHFDGVLSVVMKLLNIIQAHKAYFGEKDYQQYLLIKGMAESFFLTTEIIACPTIREQDGLAFSSRNLRLTPAERQTAPKFHAILTGDGSDQEKSQQLERSGFQVDYVQTRDGRIFGAVFLGKVRLIDNVPR